MTGLTRISVSIVEVGPRDGLQNESGPLCDRRQDHPGRGPGRRGLRYVETGSFVNPRWIPQMADSEAVFNGITRRDKVTYAALTPNLRGLERAMQAGADEIAVFAAASEAFSQKNINCSIEREHRTLSARRGRGFGGRHARPRLCLLRARLPLRGRR
jgi:hydroxymethylglutaryl-CoA lyase